MAASETTAEVTCPTHGPYTQRSLSFGGGRPIVTVHCPGCASDRNAELAKREQAERDARHKAMVASLVSASRIPARYGQATLAAPPGAAPNHQQVLARATWFLDTWPERKAKGTSLVMLGKPGTGKTHIACAIGRELLQRGESVLFTSVAEAMREIRETYNGSSKSEAQALRTFIKPSMLILDEVGASTGSDHEKHQLFEIVNGRYAELKGTILVSNLESQALLQYLGDRLMDRMREGGGKLMVFDWQSLRR